MQRKRLISVSAVIGELVITSILGQTYQDVIKTELLFVIISNFWLLRLILYSKFSGGKRLIYHIHFLSSFLAIWEYLANNMITYRTTN